MSNLYTIEVTDTFGGEANYSWVRRYLVRASSLRGAVYKLGRDYGSGWRKEYECDSDARYNLKGACICAFIDWVSSEDAERFCKDRAVKLIGFN